MNFSKVDLVIVKNMPNKCNDFLNIGDILIVLGYNLNTEKLELCKINNIYYDYICLYVNMEEFYNCFEII